jgi:membrane-bound ClpP family serine protease
MLNWLGILLIIIGIVCAAVSGLIASGHPVGHLAVAIALVFVVRVLVRKSTLGWMLVAVSFVAAVIFEIVVALIDAYKTLISDVPWRRKRPQDSRTGIIGRERRQVAADHSRAGTEETAEEPAGRLT